MHSITIISSVDKKGINQIHTYLSTSDWMDYNVRCMIKIHTANRTAVDPTAFAVFYSKMYSEAVLTTKCCILQIAVLWLKYILFAVLFTSFSPIWQMDVL